MAAKTTTVYHPTFTDVSEEVPVDDVESWVEAGWRKTPHKK